MALSKRELGRLGEKIACQFLVQHHYQIIETNFQTRSGEIDLICYDQEGAVVFIEVKTRSNLNLGYPEEAVGKIKQAKMLKVAEEYILDRPDLSDKNYYFDVLALEINFQTRLAKVKHFKHILSG
ncbi:MAG: YraN family protein [Patescibacteria group bacterium]|nr:YraN family protein [Patescibacteria group bacterium]